MVADIITTSLRPIRALTRASPMLAEPETLQLTGHLRPHDPENQYAAVTGTYRQDAP